MPPVVVLRPERAIKLGGFLLGGIVRTVPKAVPGIVARWMAMAFLTESVIPSK